MRRSAAVLPAVGAVFGVALAAGSSVLPQNDPRFEQTIASNRAAIAASSSSKGSGDPGLLSRTSFDGAASEPALSDGLIRPAQPFVFKGDGQDRSRALRCLTQAVYFEAALESDQGQAAVAQVVLNRFSFTCDGSMAQAPVGWAWDRARKVAEKALGGQVVAEVGASTHYHADYVDPWWAPTVARVTKIGAHIFYRWKGVYGESGSLSVAYKGREPLIDEARFSRPRPGAKPGQATGGADPDAALLEADGKAGSGVDGLRMETPLRTVEIDGRQRVVGVASLGGRRLPTQAEIQSINARLEALERPKPQTPTVVVAPPGVEAMEVEEVGRPQD
ncbi:hypothetical protein LTR94_027183 [Friedmanniomyces endolithicus]|nr:hypothetical protein LTR94_027183 [Friedmanniomyces endolithicus]